MSLLDLPVASIYFWNLIRTRDQFIGLLNIKAIVGAALSIHQRNRYTIGTSSCSSCSVLIVAHMGWKVTENYCL